MTRPDPNSNLRQAFGAFMTGVTVVTTRTGGGLPIGFTANSFTSVSLDPPLLLVCLSLNMHSLPAFLECEHFAVSILSEQQQDISNRFASYMGDRFAGTRWQADSFGMPLIEAATAWFSCSIHQRMEAGDHLILIGQVENFATNEVPGLGYSNQGYFSLGLERSAAEPPPSVRSYRAGAIIEVNGTVLMQETAQGLQPPFVEVRTHVGVLAAIDTHLQQNGLDAAFGPVYSIVDNPQTGDYQVFFLATTQQQHPYPQGRFVPVDALMQEPFASPNIRTMMQRYVLERQTGVFGLYLGDGQAGDVHPLGEGSKD
ncbi:MAG: flavin reductase family protein [Thiothrix sp.]|nr:flavin reductase family protein [Thiothrix sp.]